MRSIAAPSCLPRPAFTISCCTAETAACWRGAARLAGADAGLGRGRPQSVAARSAAGASCFSRIARWRPPDRARNSFMHEGRRYGHIIDPRSGWPAEGVLSVSVLAPTAAEADALSTAFYVMGLEATREYCARPPEIAAIMLCPGTRQGSLEKHVIGLEEGEWMDRGRSAIAATGIRATPYVQLREGPTARLAYSRVARRS